MRVAIARALVSVLLLGSVGAALSACHHTAEGVKEDVHHDSR
jgi:predicted small secreted protein